MSRKSPRLAAMNTMTLAEPARRSPRLAKLAPSPITELRRSPRLAKLATPITQLRRSDRIAEAKAAAQAEQAERSETAAARVEATLRRSVRINKPVAGEPKARWMAFLRDLQNEDVSDLSDSDFENDLSDSDYDYEVYKN